MFKEASGVLDREPQGCPTYRFDQRISGPALGFWQQVLELRERLLDGAEVRSVGRQVH